MNNEEESLTRLYDTIQRMNPQHHVNRIYRHTGYTVEELVANLRGELKWLADNVAGLADIVEHLLDEIDKIVKEEVVKHLPEIIEYVSEKVQAEIEKIMQSTEASAFGMPKLNNLIYGDETIVDKLSSPSFVTPHGARNTALQGVFASAQSGDLFITQSDNKGTATAEEGFVITRTDWAGNQKSEVYIQKGGHGTGIFMVERPLQKPIFFISKGGGEPYRKLSMTNADQSYLITDLPIANVVKSNGGGDSRYAESYEGKGVFINFPGVQNGARMMYVRKLQYKPDLEAFDDEGAVVPVDVSSYFGGWNDANVMQGYEIFPKRAITGNHADNDTMVIIGVSGASGMEVKFEVFEYSFENNTVTHIKTVRHVEQTFYSSRYLTPEFEGLGAIKMASGADGWVYGAIMGWSGGDATTTDYMSDNSLMITGNSQVTSALAGAQGGDAVPQMAQYNHEHQQYLYMITEYPTYQFTQTELASMKDAPRRWRNTGAIANDWFLTNSKPNKHGDIVQTLVRRNLDSPMETYVRSLNFGAESIGENRRKPTYIGKWGVVQLQNKGVTAVHNETKISQMDQYNTDYFLGNDAPNMDWEGLPPQTGWVITNVPYGWTRTLRMQIAKSYTSGTSPEVRTRLIDGPGDEFDSGLDWEQPLTKSTAWTSIGGYVKTGTVQLQGQAPGSLNTSARFRSGTGQVVLGGTLAGSLGTGDLVIAKLLPPAGATINLFGDLPSTGFISDETTGDTAPIWLDPETWEIKVNMGNNATTAEGDYVRGSITFFYEEGN